MTGLSAIRDRDIDEAGHAAGRLRGNARSVKCTVAVIPCRRNSGRNSKLDSSLSLSAAAIRRIISMTELFTYGAVYGAFFERVIYDDGKEAVQRAARRYLAASRNTTSTWQIRGSSADPDSCRVR